MSSAADRQRRYRERQRRHAAGDHGICVAGKCPAVEPGRAPAEPVTLPAESVGDGETGVTRDVTADLRSPVTNVPPPAGLGPRGVSLWERMGGRDFGPMHLVLLEEACRVADAIERLTDQLEGGEWLELVEARAEAEDEPGAVIRVVVNGLLGERRQQQEVFRRITGELRLAGRAAATTAPGATAGSPAAPPAGADGEEGGSGGVADLTAWIDAARRAATEG